MTTTPPERGPAATGDGRDRSNGRAGLDPAHGGPLPQATLAELVGRLINDVSDLADRQIDLARQEIGEARQAAISAVMRVAIGAGIAVVAALLLVIWAWTAFIWFFNWLFGMISFPTPLGTQSLAWVGWLLGLLVPAIAALVAYRRFIRRGISQAMAIWPPLPRTRETLKEDLEWVRHLRTPRER
ncbi:MAG TPA: phage holin family protein [Chloroflexota bacterium]